jgi:hypothetical protein
MKFSTASLYVISNNSSYTDNDVYTDKEEAELLAKEWSDNKFLSVTVKYYVMTLEEYINDLKSNECQHNLNSEYE